MPKKMEIFKKSLLVVAVLAALTACSSERVPRYTTEGAMVDFKKARPIKVMDSYNKTLIVADSFVAVVAVVVVFLQQPQLLPFEFQPCSFSEAQIHYSY